jgi:REP element-mobilizing transposase RayT
MAKIPLYYTFGNHMHWVDMEWLWGYHVLPGSIRDMLHFCRETGAKGNVNFDGIGYEKLAAEDPEALAELREAVQSGTIEPVGCSYGQPYGLFHGGESNIRQRIYGARAVRRLLGVWPKTFWEEEFDFFPQLPQMLKGCGFEYASLFFQWTWHTPEVPKEDVPVVWWEGQDGSRLLCATRNKLNLHQWPEDMEATFAELAASPPVPEAGPTPLILQWLELMPSPDWMCRSELLLPKLRELLTDERFEIRMATLGEYLRNSVGRSIGFQPMPESAFQADSLASEPDNFLPDEERELTIRQGAKLPHWTRDRAIYHVVFRLADSVPKQVQEEWSAERKRLDRLIAGNRLTDKEKFEYQRLYTEKIEKYLNSGQGECLLSNPDAAEIVAKALQHFDKDRYRLWAWAVMPNHVHVVVEPLSHELAEIVHSWKSFTSNRINEALGREGAVWQREYYDHIVRNSGSMTRVTNYVEMNPSKAGLADWLWVKNNWIGGDVYRRQDDFGTHPLEENREEDRQDGRQDAFEAHRLEADATGTHRLEVDGEDRRQDAFGAHRLEADATGTPRLEADATAIPTRKYSMDQVWHGMSLGKNGDNIRRLSSEVESQLLAAETLSAIAALLGRPYAQWDVYPTWELEESWRELLSAQHHDNDECEALCGHIGYFSYERSKKISGGILRKNIKTLAQSVAPNSRKHIALGFGWDHTVDENGEPNEPERKHMLVFNSLGWTRCARLGKTLISQGPINADLPAFGYTVVDASTKTQEDAQRVRSGQKGNAKRGDLSFEADMEAGYLRQVTCDLFPGGIFHNEGALGFSFVHNGIPEAIAPSQYITEKREDPPTVSHRKIQFGEDDVMVWAALDSVRDAVDIKIYERIRRPDSGMNQGLQTAFRLAFKPRIFTDQPYGVSEVRPNGKYFKKYPTGDWMTSPQWFEEVERSFTSTSFVDLVDADNPDRGLLVVHDGSQQWFLDEDNTVRCLLNMYDPWDENYFRTGNDHRFQLVPHGPITHSERWKIAQEFRNPVKRVTFQDGSELPPPFSALSSDSSNVIPTAFYRETEDFSGKHVENYAGKGMGYPFIVRLVEFDGIETEATLDIAGTVAKAFKTNMLGKIEEELHATVTQGSEKFARSRIKISMRPYEIATIYLDIIEGRKQARDLDAKREVWATVHRIAED